MNATPQYDYTRVSELNATTTPVVNIYGVVTFFKEPHATRGTGKLVLFFSCEYSFTKPTMCFFFVFIVFVSNF